MTIGYTQTTLTPEQVQEALIRGLTAPKVTRSAEAPVDPNVGDLWINSVTSVMADWTGVVWEPVLTIVDESTSEVVFQTTPPTSGKLWVNPLTMHLYAWNSANEQWVQI